MLAGSNRPFVFASGVAGFTLGRPVTETDANPAVGPDSARGGAENLALGYAARGVRVVSARFAPTVHGEGDHGFVAIIAKRRANSGLFTTSATAPTAGQPCTAATPPASCDWASKPHLPAPSCTSSPRRACALRQIAEALANRFGLPAVSVAAQQVAAEIPFVGGFIGVDAPASSQLTRERFDWTPVGPTLLDDIAAGYYDR